MELNVQSPEIAETLCFFRDTIRTRGSAADNVLARIVTWINLRDLFFLTSKVCS